MTPLWVNIKAGTLPNWRSQPVCQRQRQRGKQRGELCCIAFIRSVTAAFCLTAFAHVASDKVKTPHMTLSRTRQRITAKKSVCVVLYGDSISEVKKGWNGGATSPAKNWGAILVNKLRAAYPDSAFSLHHFAVGGQNSYEGLGRLNYLEPFKPNLVLIAFGANDCCHHFLEPAETKSALTALAVETTNRFGADVVLVGTGGDNPLQPFFRHLKETLEAQRAAAEAAKVPFVDMRQAMLAVTENGQRWAEYHLSEKDCHPNDRGHEIWAATAHAVLLSELSPCRI